MNQDNHTELETYRHSLAHILAHAVSNIYPGVKLGIGPAVEDGFYYDLDIPHRLTSTDLPMIEQEMHKIIAQKLKFKQILIPREQAFDTLHQLGQIYKTELLQQIPDENISFFKTGEEFIDLCRGPHVEHTGKLGHFKLISTEQVNWMGESSRPDMIRIKGVGFPTKEDLNQYFVKEEELKARNHQLLGPKLKIFTFDDNIGPNKPIWHQNGTKLLNNIRRYLDRVVSDNGFEFVEFPDLAKENLYDSTGYLNFRSNLFMSQIKTKNNKYLLRPDSTSQHISYFQLKKRSYKQLPVKLAEYTNTYTNEGNINEKSILNSSNKKTLQCSIFCEYEGVNEQIINLMQLSHSILNDFGFSQIKAKILLPKSADPQNYIANEKYWNAAIAELEHALKLTGIRYKVEEGDTTFYGPEVVIQVKDVYGREWDISRIVLDYNLTKMLKINYIDSEEKQRLPALITYYPFTNFEMLMALMIEHYGGAFPVWIAPTQVVLISISQKFNDVVHKVYDLLSDNNINAFADTRNETMQLKIREAQEFGIPYMVIIGEKEINTDSISVRPRSGKGQGLMRITEFIEKIQSDIKNKVIDV